MTTTPLMMRLKTETQELHKTAENQPLARALFGGSLPRQVYVQILAQRLHLHRALEPALIGLPTRHPNLEGLVRPELHFQTPRLLRDLAYFEADPESHAALPPAKRFADAVQARADRQPDALLGMFYVFEGSNNGGRFLARAVRRSYGLAGADGTRYLDPYGDDQPRIWGEFRTAMNALAWTESQSDAIVSAAGETFQAIIDLDDALWQIQPAEWKADMTASLKASAVADR